MDPSCFYSKYTDDADSPATNNQEILDAIDYKIASWNLDIIKSANNGLLNKGADQKIKLVFPQLKHSIESDLSLYTSLGNATVKKKRANDSKYTDKDGKIDEDTKLLSIRCASRFTSVTDWNTNTLDADVKTEYMHVVQSIMIREASILKLTSLLEKLDNSYWRYSMQRIKRIKKGKSLKSGMLSSYIESVKNLQKEVCVSIAHYRGSNVSIFDALHRWRNAYKCDKIREDTVSILWQGVNYLFKMQSDYTVFGNYTCIKMWLGFEPNLFMLAPSGEVYNPKLHHHERHHQYSMWLKKHQDYIRNERRKLRNAGDHTLDVDTDDPVSVNGNMETQDASAILSSNQEQRLVEEMEEDNISLQLVTPMASTLSVSEESFDGTNNVANYKSVYDNSNDEAVAWKQLRDTCARSWYDESFWSDLEHNPAVVEAAAGFIDAFPDQLLVPPIPIDLVTHCNRCLDVIAREVAIYEELTRHRLHCYELKCEVAQAANPQVLQDIKSGSRFEKSWNDHQLLKKRQQTNRGVLMKSSSSSSIIGNIESTAATACIGGDVFKFTAYEDMDHEQQQSTQRHSSSDHISKSSAGVAVNKKALLGNIENVIKARRSTVVRDGYSLNISTVTNGYRADRPPDYNSRRYRTVKCIRIQAVGRGYIARRRTAGIRKRRATQTSIRLIQRLIRGFLGRRRYIYQKRQFRVKMFVLRQLIRKKHRSVLVLTAFFRKSVEVLHEHRKNDFFARQELSMKYNHHYATVMAAHLQMQKCHATSGSNSNGDRMKRFLLNTDDGIGIAMMKGNIKKSHASDTDVVDAVVAAMMPTADETEVLDRQLNDIEHTPVDNNITATATAARGEKCRTSGHDSSSDETRNSHSVFVTSCHLIPSSRHRPFKLFAVTKERHFLQQSSSLDASSKAKSIIATPNLAYIPPLYAVGKTPIKTVADTTGFNHFKDRTNSGSGSSSSNIEKLPAIAKNDRDLQMFLREIYK